MIGLVQPQDKIVARFALTIYPYSLDFRYALKIFPYHFFIDFHYFFLNSIWDLLKRFSICFVFTYKVYKTFHCCKNQYRYKHVLIYVSFTIMVTRMQNSILLL